MQPHPIYEAEPSEPVNVFLKHEKTLTYFALQKFMNMFKE